MKALFYALVAMAAALVFAPTADAQRFGYESELVPTLESPGAAQAMAMLELRPRAVEFIVAVDGLTDGLYELIVAGESRGNFNVVGGEGQIGFRTPQRNGFREFDFDPRGQIIQVALGNTLYFGGELPLEETLINGNLPLNPVGERENLTRLSAEGRAKATVRIRSQTNKRARLQVNVNRLEPNSTADIRVNGLTIGSIVTNNRGKGRIRFSTNPKNNDELLSFDPTNSVYEILVDGLLVLEGEIFGAPIGADLEPAGLFVEPMNNLGVEPEAISELVVEEDDNRTDLTITVENLEIGTYDVFIDGSSAGSFLVESDDPDATMGPGAGDIEFSTVPGNSGRILLGSSPRGSLVRLVDEDGRVVFGLQIPEIPS